MVIDDIIKAVSESRAVDNEGPFEALGDLLGFSGENKTRTVVRAALVVAVRQLAAFLEAEIDQMPIIRSDYDAGCQMGMQMAASRIEALID